MIVYYDTKFAIQQARYSGKNKMRQFSGLASCWPWPW